MIKYYAALKSLILRETLKDANNPGRLISVVMFPLFTIGILGRGFDALGGSAVVSSAVLIFTGIIIQEPFAQASRAVLDIARERDEGLTQELMVAPIPKVLILFGKIFGSVPIGLTQALMVIFLGLILGVGVQWWQALTILGLIPFVCVAGGAYGIILVTFLRDARSVNDFAQVFFFPQFFLAGVFVPISTFPVIVKALAMCLPLTYVIEIARRLYFRGQPEVLAAITNFPLWFSVLALTLITTGLLIIGTQRFVYRETHK